MPRLPRTVLILLCLVAGMGWIAPTHPALAEVSVHALRAAMVFNFLKFTEWPDRPGSLRVCVASGDESLYGSLAELNGRKVRSMTVQVVRLSPQDAMACQVIYSDSFQRWERALEQRRASQALTISHYPGFIDDGGMIEIVTEAGMPQFDVNLGETRRVGLRLYPQLLRLARSVRE